MTTRPPMTGLRHVALQSRRFEEALDFYERIMGMNVEWHPDADNVYLTSGVDNLAIHRAEDSPAPSGQYLDHIGFLVDTATDVDRWFAYLKQQGVTMREPPRDHRDGARSFYCEDPDGVTVQIIHHPPLASS